MKNDAGQDWDDLNALTKQFIDEFDKLFAEQSPYSVGQRFVEYNGNKLDVMTYCKKRFTEIQGEE